MFSTFLGTDYVPQKGTQVVGDTTVSYFDSNDYLTYASTNFGSPGTTNVLLINYTKCNGNGKLETQLGLDTT